MPIGVFARRSGLTSSALRFYADAGLLQPAEVHPISGYRYYAVEQIEQAVLLRRLREIAMPLPMIAAVLDEPPSVAAKLVDEHVAHVLDAAALARTAAPEIKASLDSGQAAPLGTLSGPVLADAIDQVQAAAAPRPASSSLGGVHIEAMPGSLTLTATDQYRLARRTVVVAEPTHDHWRGTVHGGDLRRAIASVRRSTTVRIETGTGGIRLRLPEYDDQHCRLVSEEFPDVHRMLASLPDIRTRVVVSKATLLSALEQHSHPRVTLGVTHRRLMLASGDRADADLDLDAEISGDDLRIWFATTTLYPAVSTAIGPDVMLDFRSPVQPATIRSADRGDLMTLVMPINPHGTAGDERKP